MAEQYGGGSEPVGGLVEGAVAGVARGGLGAALTADAHGDGLHRVEAECGHAGDDLGGAQVRAGLEAVVDGDAAGPDAELGGASKARAEASAMESAPPEQATRTSGAAAPGGGCR
ncbi:hypothetical protein GCM10020254_39870 [Streptomyces goshikiensis]